MYGTMTLPIERDTVLKRVNGIEQEVAELHALATASYDAFAEGTGYKLAQYHLHRALEGVFNIGSHLLSRFPGGDATTYAEIARKLGERGVVDRAFADETLVKMAKYRNRLVHFYAEVTPEELYEVITKHMGDFDTFLSGVKRVLEMPHEYGVTVE